jgi:adenylyltransferase/sulfurtransferase
MKDMARYEKHMLLNEIGKEGQKKLLASSVAIIGCGALGSIIANALTRAGVGKIKIIDRDYVELDNLHRQILFDEEDVKKRLPKAIAAVEKLKKINSEIEVEPVIADVNPSNIEEIIKGVDLVLDGVDNMETRFLINDACVKHNIPWIYGAVIATEGMTMNILPGKTACFRCLIQKIPSPGALPTCDTAGVLNTAVNIIASLQATEAIKILAGREARREAIHVDIWKATWTSIKVEKQTDCTTCGKKNFEFLDAKKQANVTVLCGRNAVQINPCTKSKISFEDLHNKLKNVVDEIIYNEYMLRFKVEDYEFIVFEDGRTIIKGIGDVSTAKSLYAKYIGI